MDSVPCHPAVEFDPNSGCTPRTNNTKTEELIGANSYQPTPKSPIVINPSHQLLADGFKHSVVGCVIYTILSSCWRLDAAANYGTHLELISYMLFHSQEGIVKCERRLSFAIDLSTVRVVVIVVAVNLVVTSCIVVDVGSS
jgi:hypothetical protein